MTHDDRDCDLWVESEGSLSPESQQLGPWLKTMPFVPTRRYMVKVLDFFASKNSDTSTEKTSTTKKPLVVVVVRIGKTLPEIISFEKENLEASERENNRVGFSGAVSTGVMIVK